MSPGSTATEVNVGCHIPPAGFRGAYRADAEARAIYSEAAGIERIVPAAVAVPTDANDVVTLVRWAREQRLPLVCRGSGTSMANGAIGAGVIVDLSRMNEVGAVSVESRSVWVGPGALRGTVNAAAGARGLRFPVDPSSGAYCTIGGMVSTNAAGAHSLLHGATRGWVLSLDCVFEDGSRAVISRGRPPNETIPALERFRADAHAPILALGRRAERREVCKNSSGYALAAYAESEDLVDLLVGSEGTLAIVVGVELRLTDEPEATSALLATFASLDDAVTAAIAARAVGAAACELLDRTFLDLASARSGAAVSAFADLPEKTEAVLLVEFEGGSESAVESRARDLAQNFESAGATSVRVALGAIEQHEIWELRHAASPILARLDSALKSMQFIEDGAVPPSRLAKYVRGVRAALARQRVRGVIFGHAGDAHMHVNPLVDVSDANWRARVDALLEEVVALTAGLGGTLSGEHGDGRLRAPFLSRVWPEEVVRAFRLVKNAFDPPGIFNPGVKIPLEKQRPVGDVKYDPALAPLPLRVREQLDRIVRDRAYADFRLSLLEGPD